jgi:hypothetical protein
MKIVFHGKNKILIIWTISLVGFTKLKDFYNRSKMCFVTSKLNMQGEQWHQVARNILSNIEIDFAHLSFKWTNNAKGNAGSNCYNCRMKM